MKKPAFLFFLVFLCAAALSAQIPINVEVQILKAEDARRYDRELETLLKSPNEDIRIRAALAAGRIGNAAAVPALVRMLQSERSAKAQDMAAFALGEIESVDAADAILRAIGETAKPNLPGVAPSERGRLAEAAGKIAAAIPQAETEAAASVPDIKKRLGEAIIFTLEAEHHKGAQAHKETVLLALTAALRARPEKADVTVQKFLAYKDADIVANALNTLARLRAKNANKDARVLLANHTNAVVRANAARVLGAAEDKEAVDALIKAATGDTDSRVRVSAIRALASFKNAEAADKMLQYGEKLLADYRKSKLANPVEKNELLEVATALGRVREGTNDGGAIKLLDEFRNVDTLRSPETEIAFARISPKTYLDRHTDFIASYKGTSWRAFSSVYQGLSQIAALETNESNKAIIRETNFRLLKSSEGWFWSSEKKKAQGDYKLAVPDLLRAMAARKVGDSSGIFQPMLDRENDVFIRATLAELLGEQPKSKENIETLIVAFAKSLETDKNENDVQLAVLDALYKLDKKETVGSLLRALNAPDYLVRKKAFQLLADDELQKEFPEIEKALSLARGNHMHELIEHDSEMMQVASRSGTKLGQILNADADYRRAAARKNGNVKAVLTTEKGTFTIDLLPEDAPLTVDNFIKLARSNYFNGLEIHRVVPNFVMQDGDPRGDGNGGPGWSIRCEINMVPYERGAVGMALSGKDTGGSQWFVTHSPQPHLDGGYTVFGRVNETGMKVVDNVVRGDKILKVRIIDLSKRK